MHYYFLLPSVIIITSLCAYNMRAIATADVWKQSF